MHGICALCRDISFPFSIVCMTSAGNARYDICALWGILKNRHAPVSIWMDGQLLSADVTVLAVNHTQHMGRGLRGCPNARWDDAVLDIMYINRTTRAKLVRMFNGVKTGGACRWVCRWC